MLFKRFFTLLAITLFLPVLFFTDLKASVMSGEELILNLLLSQKNITQFKLNAFVTVYDPEAEVPLSEPLLDEQIKHELPDQAYIQNIVWIRDEFTGVETLSPQQEPYHIFILAENQRLSENLTEERKFADIDIEPCLLPFFTKHKSVMLKRLNAMGIETNNVEYITRDYRVFYKLGKGKSYLLIDPIKYRIIEAHREVNIDGRDYKMSVKFNNWHERYENLPQTFEYYINDRIFKTVNIDRIQRGGLWRERNLLVKKYQSRITNMNLKQLEVNYAQ